MTRTARFSKHRGLAYTIAGDYRVAGYDRDDLTQEALIALWLATGTWDGDESKGSFVTWARRCMHGRLIDLLREAGRDKRRALNEAHADDVLELVAAPIDVEAYVAVRDELRSLVARRDEMLRLGRRRFSWRESKRRRRERLAA